MKRVQNDHRVREYDQMKPGCDRSELLALAVGAGLTGRFCLEWLIDHFEQPGKSG
ncbi:hypothetical protein [Actibacterium sp.]|jgi:hypothetical protein|uniref:hypothetical protein n=1 Tax=Actibacterium sp. TaxID=1872125 RepID=UPI00257B0804|nr:hypothetical protein [Actibacterium sp.]|tara:strand:- start:331 stop:495 length:165 start_codon:yes stop_codon:yes gene_type:complete